MDKSTEHKKPQGEKGGYIDAEALQKLLTTVETVVGHKMATPRDFNGLCAMMSSRMGVMISSSTLKRVWGYVPSDNVPSLHTLNILARFCGYKDLEDFRKMGTNIDALLPSSPVEGETLNVLTELKKGDRVRIYWQPGRVCEVEYNGSLHFEVKYTEEMHLRLGDTFLASLLVTGYPLMIEVQSAETNTITPYVCGKNGGIWYEVIRKRKLKQVPGCGT